MTDINDVVELIKSYKPHDFCERADKIMPLLAKLPDHGIAGVVAALDKGNEDDVRHFARQILDKMEPHSDAIAPLIVLLDDDDSSCQLDAAELLSRHGKNAIDAVPIMDRWLNNSNDAMQLMAAIAISRICPDRFSEMFPLLLDLTPKQHDLLRKKLAIQVIGDWGKDFPETLPFLNQLLTKDCPITQTAASAAIVSITGDRALAISLGLYLLGSKDMFDRFFGVPHLKEMGVGDKPTLDALRKIAASDPVDPVRNAALEAVEELEKPSG